MAVRVSQRALPFPGIARRFVELSEASNGLSCFYGVLSSCPSHPTRPSRSRMDAALLRGVYPRHLSESIMQVAIGTREDVAVFRGALPSHSSESFIRVIHPRHISELFIRVIYPSRNPQDVAVLRGVFPAGGPREGEWVSICGGPPDDRPGGPREGGVGGRGTGGRRMNFQGRSGFEPWERGEGGEMREMQSVRDERTRMRRSPLEMRGLG